MAWEGLDIYLGGYPDPTYRGPSRPMWTPQNESSFQGWYGELAKLLGLNPNPDDKQQMYDYRGAYQRGNSASSKDFHWPSDLKYPEHPRRYINGYDTTTGGLAPMITNWLWED